MASPNSREDYSGAKFGGWLMLLGFDFQEQINIKFAITSIIIAMSFELLPTEMKTAIFSYFTTRELHSTIAPVSAQWKTLAYQPELWKNIEFRSKEFPAEEVIEHLNQCTLAQSVKFFDYVLENPILCSTLPNIHVKKLKFTKCLFTEHELSRLVENYPNVESFHLICTRVDGCTCNRWSEFTLNAFKIITDWKRLKSVKLTGCHPELKYEDEILTTIAHKCKFLEKFCVAEFCSVGSSACTTFMELRGPQLRVAVLDGDILVSDIASLFVEKCVNLTRLKLIGVPQNIRDKHFILLSKLPVLKRLDIKSTRRMYVDFNDDDFSWDREEHFRFYKRGIFHHLEEFNFDCDWPITGKVITLGFPNLKRINNITVQEYLRRESEMKLNLKC